MAFIDSHQAVYQIPTEEDHPTESVALALQRSTRKVSLKSGWDEGDVRRTVQTSAAKAEAARAKTTAKNFMVIWVGL